MSEIHPGGQHQWREAATSRIHSPYDLLSSMSTLDVDLNAKDHITSIHRSPPACTTGTAPMQTSRQHFKVCNSGRLVGHQQSGNTPESALGQLPPQPTGHISAILSYRILIKVLHHHLTLPRCVCLLHVHTLSNYRSLSAVKRQS